MSSLLTFVVFAAVLVLIQAVVALPWVFVVIRRPIKLWLQATGLVLAVVVAFQYRKGFPASPDTNPLAITLIHRAA